MHIFEQCTSFDADIVKYCVLKIALVVLNNPACQLFLDESAYAVIATLIVNDRSLVNLKNVHQRIQTFLKLREKLMLI